MDNYKVQGGKISYTASSMPLSGEIMSYDFKLQTTRETVDKTIDLLPGGYYNFVDPGENIQYLLQKNANAKHTFYLGKHITDLTLKKSITQLVNDVYYVGGQKSDGSTLYRHTPDNTSITTYRRGLNRLSDSRVILDDSADALMDSELDQYKVPRYRTTVKITDAVYDTESVKLGEMVGFKNTGSFVDNLVLQIVTLHKAKHSVTLDLDMIVPSDTKRLYELKKELMSQVVETIADAPA